MTVEILARLQFAFTIAFHYLFPPLSIGLGVIIVVIEGLWLKTGDGAYLRMAKFWVKVFALTFALGVASGIVMEFQFGTNWATYSRFVGDVFGSALAAEGIFAFFLESGFLAVLLFGWDKVKPRMHFFAALMVCVGAHFSAVWIIVANSWQQTPAGYHLVQHGETMRAEITDFWAVVFNPSSMERLSHTLSGCWQAGAFLVLSVSAYYLLTNRHLEFARRSFKTGLCLAAVAGLLQFVTGHASAKVVAEHQPAKLAAMEGHYSASAPADLYLFGWVDDANERVIGGVKMPGMLSWLVHGDSEAPVTGLNSFDKADRPPVNVTFQCYHGMVAIGCGLMALSALGLYFWWRGTLFQKRWLLWLFVFAVLGPQLANQLGWFTAEIGRQPWVVYGLLRTSDGLSKVVDKQQIIGSLIMFGMIYALLFALFIYLLHHKISHGPDEAAEAPAEKVSTLTSADHASA
jgi:cytochrome bd ubiquinol oxidase subunit I